MVLYMCLHGTFLPQLAFGRREHLPDNSCGGEGCQKTTIRGRGSHRSDSTPADRWEVAIVIVHLSTFGSVHQKCPEDDAGV
ncbi:hypothetical protein BC826DRAFT_1078268, partial [Russula brevipes]